MSQSVPRSNMTKLKKFNLPTGIVILGATGDLAQTKLLPALFDLFNKDVLPDAFTVIGLSRTKMSDEEYRLFVTKIIGEKADAERVAAFCGHLRYESGDFTDAAVYEQLKKRLFAFDDEIGQCTSKLFYIAVHPSLYATIFTRLKESQAMSLCSGIGTWARLLVEKPFGSDSSTAALLERQLEELFPDDQIYRIDHYLAKDAIENIIALRFANNILEGSWNGREVESIDLRLLEKKDVANRGLFYHDIGTLRDVGQNHMLQMFALLTMDAIVFDDPAAMRSARARAIALLQESKILAITRGQYEGFTESKGVGADSQTETYFKVDTEITEGTWKGVRFSFESGKALDREVTEAVITFRPFNGCRCGYLSEPHGHKNELRITFSPLVSIALTLWVKQPGFGFTLEPRVLQLGETEDIESDLPSAYERVLFDAIAGNQTRFVSGAEVIAAWKFITPLLQKFTTLPLPLDKPGTRGPIIEQTT
jgi:glucose-6-phosphate 1-dehydrogenase